MKIEIYGLILQITMCDRYQTNPPYFSKAEFLPRAIVRVTVYTYIDYTGLSFLFPIKLHIVFDD